MVKSECDANDCESRSGNVSATIALYLNWQPWPAIGLTLLNAKYTYICTYVFHNRSESPTDIIIHVQNCVFSSKFARPLSERRTLTRRLSNCKSKQSPPTTTRRIIGHAIQELPVAYIRVYTKRSLAYTFSVLRIDAIIFCSQIHDSQYSHTVTYW